MSGLSHLFFPFAFSACKRLCRRKSQSYGYTCGDRYCVLVLTGITNSSKSRFGSLKTLFDCWENKRKESTILAWRTSHFSYLPFAILFCFTNLNMVCFLSSNYLTLLIISCFVVGFFIKCYSLLNKVVISLISNVFSNIWCSWRPSDGDIKWKSTGFNHFFQWCWSKPW